jgi:hypothetical protein
MSHVTTYEPINGFLQNIALYHVIFIIIINVTTAQSRALASLTGFVTVRYVMMWVISPTINLILVILIQPPETSSGGATIDI